MTSHTLIKSKIIHLLLGVLLALTIATIINAEKYIILLGLSGLLLYLVIPLNIKFFLLVMGSFFPLSFGNAGPINAFLWVEWMAPLLFLICLYHQIIEKKQIFPKNDRIFFIAIIVLLTWAGINYCWHPVSAQRLFGTSEEQGGLRSYYAIFIGTCIFFSCFWYSRQIEDHDIWESFLKVIIIFCLILGCLRIISYHMDINIPFIYGTFRYGVDLTGLEYSENAFRIGGLSDVAGPGAAALFALRYGKKWHFKHFIILGIFGVFIILSGGRSFAVGFLCAYMAYMILVDRSKLVWIIPIVMALTLMVISGWEGGPLRGQVDRLLNVGIAQDYMPHRWEAYRYMLKVFIQNPIFGKGIGSTVVVVDTSEFVQNQIKVGGHGTYLSIMAIFGIGGIFFLLAMLFGSLYKGYKYLIISSKNTCWITTYVVFMTFFFSVRVFEYVVGGNGYKDFPLYLMVGFFMGIQQGKRQTDEI